MLNLPTLIKRVSTKDRILSYALGRFKVVREVYSSYYAFLQLPQLFKQDVDSHEEETLFNEVDVDETHRAIRNEAVFLGLNLQAEVVESIKNFARNTALSREDGSPYFFYHDVKDGYLPDGRPVPQAIAVNPLKCEAIQKILNDPVLLKIISKYLRYRPHNIHPVLKWSFVLQLSDFERVKLHQTVHYHYDVHGFNFVYANFYLSDVDEYSGAHMMIKASHEKKSVQMLFGSAVQSEDNLYNYYGKESELIVRGKAGYGFIQDASCYHKALKPISRERLMLQIRYW